MSFEGVGEVMTIVWGPDAGSGEMFAKTSGAPFAIGGGVVLDDAGVAGVEEGCVEVPMIRS